MITEQINVKLTLWGTNRGSQIFATDLSQSDKVALQSTLQEFAAVFLNAGVPFYGIEFTSEYKVYTAYYSAMEERGTRNGIFVAATIFVPHKYRLLDPLAYLQKMGQKVKEVFLDLNGRYKGGLPPSLERDFAEYREVSVEKEHIVRRDFISDTKGSLAYIICSDDTNIADILREPYRKEFKPHQEILLIPQTHVVSGRFSHTIGQPLELASLSRQHNGYRLQQNELIAEIKIAGEDRKQDYDTQYLGTDTLLELRLTREGYEPISYLSASLMSYIRRELLKQVDEEQLILNDSKLAWKRCKKVVRFTLNPITFRQTERAQLKVGGTAPQELHEHRAEGYFWTELEEDLLNKEAALILFKQGESISRSLKIGSLSDSSLVDQKCQSFRYPEPITPRPNPEVPKSSQARSEGNASFSPPAREEEPKNLWGDRPQVKANHHQPYGKEYNHLDGVKHYWKALLCVLLVFLVGGYFLGNYYPVSHLSGQSPNKFTKEAAKELLLRQQAQDSLVRRYGEGVGYLYQEWQQYKQDLDNLRNQSASNENTQQGKLKDLNDLIGTLNEKITAKEAEITKLNEANKKLKSENEKLKKTKSSDAGGKQGGGKVKDGR